MDVLNSSVDNREFRWYNKNLFFTCRRPRCCSSFSLVRKLVDRRTKRSELEWHKNVVTIHFPPGNVHFSSERAQELS